MRNEEKTIVIVVDIADADRLKKSLSEGTQQSDAYFQRIVRPVASRLQKFCNDNRAILSNKVSPFVVETGDPQTVVNIAHAILNPGEGGIRVTVPDTNDPVRFYVGISCRSQLDDQSEFRGVSHARALAGGAGPNEIKIEDEVAVSLTDLDLSDLEILFLGRHRLLDEEKSTRIFQLRAAKEPEFEGDGEGEIVRLTLAVVDIVHSTALKPLMGSSQQDRLENYDRRILKPFREKVATLARQFGGAIVDQTGDSSFLSFNDPDPARRFALAVLDEGDRIPAPDGYGWPVVKYHISIDSGRVMRNAEGLLQGHFVDRVHRLNDLSQDDQILLAPSVATTLQEELVDEGADGHVHRHKSVNLQGIVEDVEVWEYCPPGREPRPPRKGKGQTQLKPAALAAVSGLDTLNAYEQEIERVAKRLRGQETRIDPEQAERTRVFAFDRVQDSVRFLIEVRKLSGEQCRGAAHYGLVIEKSDGLLEGTSTAETIDLVPATDHPGTVRMSGSAARHVADRKNRHFRVRLIEGATVRLQDHVETVYEVIPRISPVLQYLRLATIAVLAAAAGIYLFHDQVRSPRQASQALFISLAPALDGQSWWFDISPWFTPEMRLRFYRERGRGTPLGELKTHMLRSDGASNFYLTLKDWLAREDDSIAWRLAHELARRDLDQETVYGLISEILERESLAATDWHLVANLLTSLSPSRDAPWDTLDFQNLHRSWLPLFRNSRNDYQRALFAFGRARELYQDAPGREGGDREILSGLLALCHADQAWLHYSRREVEDCIEPLIYAEASLNNVEDTLLDVFIFALRGESKVRLYAENWDANSKRDPDLDFDKAVRKLERCFARLRNREIDPGDHLFAAAIHQMKAFYYLETWKLDRSEDRAKEAGRIRQEMEAVQRLIQLPDPELTGSLPPRLILSERSGVYNDTCLQYIRCRFLEALAAHFSGNAHNAERALREAIYISRRAGEWQYLGEDSLWKEFQSNFHQRFAEYHIFISGDLEEARLNLDQALQKALEQQWDRRDHRYHSRYIEQRSRQAWMDAILGKKAEARADLEELERQTNLVDLPDDMKPLYFKVALAFTEEEPDLPLQKLVFEKLGDDTISRDDRQLLLMICDYLRGVPGLQTEEITTAYRQFSIPWSVEGAIGSSAYLHAVRNRAHALRCLHHGTMPEAVSRLEAASLAPAPASQP